MGEGDSNGTSEQRPALGLLASLCVLGAVFYFINAACDAGGGDDGSSGGSGSGGSPSCVTPIPSGSGIAFASPRAGAVVTGSVIEGTIAVPVELTTFGLVVVAADGSCVVGEGHFSVFADGVGVAHLRGGETATTVQVEPGMHTLSASFVNSSERHYTPRITTAISIRVERETP